MAEAAAGSGIYEHFDSVRVIHAIRSSESSESDSHLWISRWCVDSVGVGSVWRLPQVKWTGRGILGNVSESSEPDSHELALSDSPPAAFPKSPGSEKCSTHA